MTKQRDKKERELDLFVYKMHKSAQERVNKEYASREVVRRRRRDQQRESSRRFQERWGA